MEGAVVVTLTINVAGELPLMVAEGDDGAQVASEGAPEQLMFTVPLNPPAGVIWRL